MQGALQTSPPCQKISLSDRRAMPDPRGIGALAVEPVHLPRKSSGQAGHQSTEPAWQKLRGSFWDWRWAGYLGQLRGFQMVSKSLCSGFRDRRRAALVRKASAAPGLDQRRRKLR